MPTGKSSRLFVKFAAKFLAGELYRGVFGREPDAGELASCATAIKSTGDLERLLKGLLQSPEFQNRLFDSAVPGVVRAAYKGLLGREPDNDGLKSASARLIRHRDISALLQAIVGSAEFRRISMKQIVLCEYLAPLWSEQMSNVDFDATAGQLDLLFERIRSGWTLLGDTEPHWSVLTHESFKSKTFAGHEAEFYKSGFRTISMIDAVSKRAGLEINPAATVLELGCGTGRVTHVLADRYARVLAVDVSPGNLRLCQEKLIQMGKTNVECLLLKSPRDIENILPVDLFFSTIVLQHNPPPVIHYFLDQIFGKIREGGSVIFQVPTDRSGYSFNVIEYLASAAPAMEMHALPMRAIFSLFAKHRLRPLEVLMDGWTASLGSHMFFAVRE